VTVRSSSPAASADEPQTVPTGSDRPPFVPRARLILVLLALFSIINFGDKAVLGLAGPSITSDLGLTNTQFGLIGSGFYFLFSLSALLVGLFGGRWPATWLLAGMAVIWSAAQLPILIPSTGFAVLVVTRVILGAGEGPSLPMANHVAFTWFPAVQRTTAAGVITMGGALGVIFGGPLLAVTITFAGWRWAFGLLGVLGLAWTIAWLRIGGEGPYAATRPNTASIEVTVETTSASGVQPAQHPGQPVGVRGQVIPVSRILANPTWIAGVVAGFTGQWALGLGLSWLPTFLEEEGGYGSATVGFLIGLPSLVAVISVPTVVYLAYRRRIAGRSSHSTYALLGFCAAAVPAAGLFAMTLGLQGPGLLVSVSIAFGAGIALAPLVASAIADLVPVERRGVALCIGTAISSFGAVVSPWATGRLLDLADNEQAGFDHAFRLAAGLALLGGVSLLFLNPERDARRLIR
jgi:MFS family permease